LESTLVQLTCKLAGESVDTGNLENVVASSRDAVNRISENLNETIENLPPAKPNRYKNISSDK
jgi:hypothetical protein